MSLLCFLPIPLPSSEFKSLSALTVIVGIKCHQFQIDAKVLQAGPGLNLQLHPSPHPFTARSSHYKRLQPSLKPDFLAPISRMLENQLKFILITNHPNGVTISATQQSPQKVHTLGLDFKDDLHLEAQNT